MEALRILRENQEVARLVRALLGVLRDTALRDGVHVVDLPALSPLRLLN
ncbi:hypothetical protein [Streptomyces sp. NPDC093260]